MRRFFLLILIASLTTTFGCGKSEPKGKELEELQEKAQQKADDEERQYQKEQKELNKKR